MPISDFFATANGFNDLVAQGAFKSQQGINYSGYVWGSIIPVSAGFRKVPGSVIWSGAPFKDNIRTQYQPALPGVGSSFPVTYSTWNVKRNFAVALGKRLNPGDPPPLVRRVWADGTLVWSNGQGAPLVWSGLGGLPEPYLPTGQTLNGIWVPDPTITSNDPQFGNQDLGPVGSEQMRRPIQSNLKFTFHDGDEAQLPDPTIAAAIGPLAPAYRGLMYMVITGLVVGLGTSIDENLSAFGQTPGTGDIEDQTVVPEKYPLIEVELADGSLVTADGHDFTRLAGATPYNFPSEVVLADWKARETAVIAPDPAGSHLNIYDMDSGAQTLSVLITGAGADMIGPTGGFAAWDKINGIFYTENAGDHCVSSLNRAGAIISTVLTVAPNLSPDSADHNPITDADPAVKFPRPNYSDIEYAIMAGALQPVLLAGTIWTAAFTPSAAGVIPPTLRPQSFYQAAASLRSVKAFPLSIKAITEQHLSYQDCAFVTASPAGVEVVYVTVGGDPASGNVSANIVGRKTVYTPVYGVSACLAVLDSTNNIVIEEYQIGLPILLTKIPVTIDLVADLALAPGWRGLFPHPGAASLKVSLPPASAFPPWEGNSLTQSDTSANTYGSGAAILDLGDFSVQTLAGFDGLDSTTSAWDSVYATRYFHGNISGFGNGMRYAQVFSGIDGSISTVGGYLRLLAKLGGFQDGDLDVDTGLTDQVPGLILLHPYSLTTLFNDIGAMYEFTYFNSAGKLKFSRSSNSPIKSAGGWTITGNQTVFPSVTIQDGDTATIGSFVYRFMHVPVQPFDVKISVDTPIGPLNPSILLDAMEKTAANFLAALKGDLTFAAKDSQNPLSSPGFFAGTVKNSLVEATSTKTGMNNFGFTNISLVAVVGGAAGNSIVTAATGTHQAFDHATLTNGSEVPTPSINLTKKNLAFVQDQQISENDALITQIAPMGQAQKAAAVTYYALEQNYIASSQTFVPDNQNGGLGVTGSTTVTYNLPFVMSTSEAYSRVVKTAIRDADNVVVQNFRLTQAFLLLEPSDIIAVTLGPFRYTIRLDECTFNGDFSTSFTAANYLFRSDVPINTSDSTSQLPQSVATGNDAYPVVVDAPLIDPRFGTSPGQVNLFDGVRAYQAGGFYSAVVLANKVVAGVPAVPSELFTTSDDIRWGTLPAGLPAAVEPFYRTTEGFIDLQSKTIVAADLASASYVDFVAGKNCLAVGTPGNWEFIFFRDVAQINIKTFRLTGLIRAQRGTDAAVAGHTANDIVLLVSSVAPGFTQTVMQHPQAVPSSDVGSTYHYVARGLPKLRSVLESNVPVNGYALYPFSPCRFQAPLQAGNDLLLSWERRDRLGTKFVTVAQPMSEALEQYDLEIYSGVTLKRTLTNLTTKSFTYTSAMQVTDGFAPPLASIKFKVFQKGELGRGFPRTETVNVS